LTYSTLAGGHIYRYSLIEERSVFTRAVISDQAGMDSDPLFENGIALVIRASDGGFWW
jgi:hypothetical protein